jgi:hypothetical protein
LDGQRWRGTVATWREFLAGLGRGGRTLISIC